MFLAAIAAAIVGCQSTRSPAAEPMPGTVEQAIYRPATLPAVNPAIYVKPAVERQEIPVQLVGARAETRVQVVSDARPARFPLARGVVDCFRVRVPNPCPRVCPPTPATVVVASEDRPVQRPAEAAAEKEEEPDRTALFAGGIVGVGFLAFVAAIPVGFLVMAKNNVAGAIR